MKGKGSVSAAPLQFYSIMCVVIEGGMCMKKLLIVSMSILFIVTFGIFIYPGLYKYDKLEQKYPIKINRLTGSTQILTQKGWISADNPKESQMEALRKELFRILQDDRDNLKDDIIKAVEHQIKEVQQQIITETKNEQLQILTEIENELVAAKEAISEYRKFNTDPDNYFTIGSAKEEVKRIMGAPTDINSYLDWWYYGYSHIEFENGKVKAYSNQGNLRVK